MSGNTIGAKLYSDGKSIAPMLPKYPKLTSCNNCSAIFWLNKLEELGTFTYENPKPEWKNVPHAKFLSIEQYFTALKNGIAENKKEELLIRQYIWWAYNDRLRNGEQMFNTNEEEKNWEDNTKKLIALLDASDLNQQIMIAEANRNLGNFEACLDIIKNIHNENLDWLKKQMLHECEVENRWVVQLFREENLF